MYQANRYDRAGAKAGLNQYDVYKGHSGPVMGLHFHPLHGPVDFSDLFLTCSVDWTVKLWRAKSLAKPSTSTNAISPLYSFDEADDYVYDVKWHPAHPAVFGSVDGSGKFDLWNLNSDTEVSHHIALTLRASELTPSRSPWCPRPWARDARSTSCSGITRTVGAPRSEGATEGCTCTTLETRHSPERQSGRICRERSPA